MVTVTILTKYSNDHLFHLFYDWNLLPPTFNKFNNVWEKKTFWAIDNRSWTGKPKKKSEYPWKKTNLKSNYQLRTGKIYANHQWPDITRKQIVQKSLRTSEKVSSSEKKAKH